ncbi:MAG: hypothetical protein N3B16_08910 [Candidatus Aminicenantes bacterium]|nr:hypothetical protein [Candidatus Aminicenantes bacterium]
MSLVIREVSTPRERKIFIFLPEKIHRDHKNWVPPIWIDEKRYFNPNKNRAFAYCDTLMLLAWRDTQPVGRIMGIINHRYNEYRNEKTARFGYLEAYEDKEVVQALLSSVEEWARSKGMTKVVGPYGFSDQDPEGFLIQGFENRATIATYYNFEWMPRLVEEAGYSKDVDYFVYKIVIPKELPDFYQKIYDRVMKRGSFTILEFKKRKELKPWIRPVLSLMNECYLGGEIYGYAPLDETEMDELAKRYLPVIDPRFVKIVLKEKEPVAFIVGLPDITEGIQKARGRLFPFGFIHILRAARRSKQLDLLLGAIKEKYRGMGLDVLMGVKMLQSAWEAGFEIIDTHHEMETNYRVRGEMERMGGVIYKIYRVYQKVL